MSANVKEASSPMNEIPGAKLKRLREDLQKKIAIRRSANWAQKQKETKELLGITGPDDEEEEDEFGDTYKGNFITIEEILVVAANLREPIKR